MIHKVVTNNIKNYIVSVLLIIYSEVEIHMHRGQFCEQEVFKSRNIINNYGWRFVKYR